MYFSVSLVVMAGGTSRVVFYKKTHREFSLGMSGKIAIVKTAAKKISLAVMMRTSSSLPKEDSS